MLSLKKIFLKGKEKFAKMSYMSDLIEIIQISPGIRLDIRYATSRNFTGRAIYPSDRCFLQRKTAQRLHQVQCALEKKGLGLKVFDGYRPLSVQKIFWELVPNPSYVADPAIGSKHNRGASVDLTLVDARGIDLPMPTEFDAFCEEAAHSYQGGSKEELLNRETLKQAMMSMGFLPYEKEWWHYDDPEWERYPILDIDIPN